MDTGEKEQHINIADDLILKFQKCISYIKLRQYHFTGISMSFKCIKHPIIHKIDNEKLDPVWLFSHFKMDICVATIKNFSDRRLSEGAWSKFLISLWTLLKAQKACLYPTCQHTSRSSLILAPFTPMMEPARLWWISRRSSQSKSMPLYCWY